MSGVVALSIPLLPGLAGVLIGLLGRRLRERSAEVGIAAVTVACLLSVYALYLVVRGGPFEVVLVPLAHPAVLPKGWTLYVDRLSAVMLILITAVSTVVHRYSRQYLQGERGYPRFYALLGLMTAVLVTLVCSANLFMLFVFWQLLSWLLYLLLVFDYERRPACRAALKTFLVHRFGDLFFLGGVVLAFQTFGTLELPELFARAAGSTESLVLWQGADPGSGLSLSVTTAIALLIFVGAMAKSAQFPLHVWLPDTMDTPTPVSALMHAGIVNAGGFLLNRLAPLYAESPETLHLAFVVGGMTAILGASIMLTQNDVKKTLGFSTMGQMGYMIMECGLGAFALAVFHLIAHGLFKATLFLGSGTAIHVARHEDRLPEGRAAHQADGFPRLAWATGLTLTLILPLLIVLLGHNVLHVPLLEVHGSVIFLFFSWVTASQVIFSLYRLHAIGSWKVAGAMVLALLLLVVTYLWAGEAFSEFLYPAPGEVAHYFAVAALPWWAFDTIVVGATLLIVGVWVLLYADARGQRVIAPDWVSLLQRRLYVWFTSRLYVDQLYERLGTALHSCGRRLRATVETGRRLAPLHLYAILITALLLFVLSGLVPPSAAGVLRTVAAVILLPLFPLHGILVEVAGRAQGALSLVLAVLIPAVGFMAAGPAVDALSAEVRLGLAALSIVSVLYGSIVALAERHVKRRVLLAYVGQLGLVWWFLLMGTAGRLQIVGVLSATMLVAAGLLAAWSYVERRVGDATMDQVSGLATSMPRLSVLFSLWTMAAIGLPIFGLFFTTMAAIIAAGASAGTLLLVGVAWMLAGWQYVQLLDDLWFGRPRFPLIVWDLSRAETLALSVFLLLAVGVTFLHVEQAPFLQAVLHARLKG